MSSEQPIRAESFWSFVDGATLARPPALSLRLGNLALALAGPSEIWTRLLHGVTMSSLKEAVGEKDLASIMGTLGQLVTKGVLEETLAVDGKPTASRIVAKGFLRRRYQEDTEVVLSRYAFVRQEAGATLLESPLTAARVQIFHPGDLAEVFGPARLCRSALSLFLFESGFLVPNTESELAETLHWEFHDLLFHWRSRIGRHHYPWGALGGTQPPPELHAPISGSFLALPRQSAIRQSPELTLTQALETRRSRRSPGETDLGLPEISEFLFRSVRQTERGRLYPSGGGRYELEVYLNVQGCQGLADGFYRYDPHHHQLEHLNTPAEFRRAHLDFAKQSCLAEVPPRVFLVLAARFQRLSTRYQTVAYALILKHVGVLLATFSLVCTDLNLAGCAVGSGDTALFQSLSGLSWLEESSVGEFALW